MNGLGGLNKSPNGVVIGLVQLQLPKIETRADIAAQTDRIVALVAKARANLGTMDLVVFPEYALHGLSMDIRPEILCTLDGPEVAAFKRACAEHRIWGCFSIMEANPGGMPYNSGLIIDDQGALKLYYRKMHPWVPVEPWEPGNLGIPVIEGPKGAKIGLIICHDGMFPEMAREAAYKGAEIMIRTAGYTAPIRESWRFTNQSNAFCNLMVTANVCLCGSDGTFDSMGEGMICNFDGTVLAHGTTGRADEIITAEVRPDLVREARVHWGVENNIYQFGHRGYTAVKGGAQDCPYTYMTDLAAGRYRLPWEDQVVVTDGTGFPARPVTTSPPAGGLRDAALAAGQRPPVMMRGPATRATPGTLPAADPPWPRRPANTSSSSSTCRLSGWLRRCLRDAAGVMILLITLGSRPLCAGSSAILVVVGARLGDHPELGGAGHRQAGQGLVLRHRSRTDPHPAGHPQPDPHRHHHRRLRPHDDARGQRPRLRMRDRVGRHRRDRSRQP